MKRRKKLYKETSARNVYHVQEKFFVPKKKNKKNKKKKLFLVVYCTIKKV